MVRLLCFLNRSQILICQGSYKWTFLGYKCDNQFSNTVKSSIMLCVNIIYNEYKADDFIHNSVHNTDKKKSPNFVKKRFLSKRANKLPIFTKKNTLPKMTKIVDPINTENITTTPLYTIETNPKMPPKTNAPK